LRWAVGRWYRGRRGIRGALARHGHTRRKQRTLVRFVLHSDSYGDRLQTLKPGRGFEMRTLLAAVQSRIALGAIATEVNIGGKRRGAVEAPRCRHMLHQPRQPRAGYIDGRARTLRPWPVLATRTSIGAVRILVPRLSVLAIAVHGEECSVKW